MNIAAFFDIDGTLVAPPSLETRFLRFLWWRGDISSWDYARCLGPIVREAAHAFLSGEWQGLECVAARCKDYLAGVRTAAMDAWLGWMERHPVAILPAAARRMAWHAVQGHRMFLLSGTLAPLAEAVARRLPVPVRVCATELESVEGRWTGRVWGEAVCGPAKARAMERLASEFSLDLARSYAYGDSYTDRWMLERTGNPRVIRGRSFSSRRLARLAQQRGWPVLPWGRERSDEEKNDAETQRARRSAEKSEWRAA